MNVINCRCCFPWIFSSVSFGDRRSRDSQPTYYHKLSPPFRVTRLDIDRVVRWTTLFDVLTCSVRCVDNPDHLFARCWLADGFLWLWHLFDAFWELSYRHLQLLSSSHRGRLKTRMCCLFMIYQKRWIESDWRVCWVSFVLAMRRFNLHRKDARKQCQEATDRFYDRLHFVEEWQPKLRSTKIANNKSPNEQSFG